MVAKNIRVLFLVLMLMAGVSGQGSAQKDTTGLFDLSIDELLNLSAEITTALKAISTAERAPAVVYVITREEMDNMGFRTLGDALNFVPGFTVGKGFQAGQQKNIYLRGEFSQLSEGILFLYDGQRMNDGVTGGAVAFNPDYALDNIKQIEVIRGPVSALYGANAFVGVVNLIPFRPDEVTGVRVHVRGGNQESVLGRAEAGFKIGKSVDVLLYGSYSRFRDEISQRDIRIAVFDSVSGMFVPDEFNDRVNAEKVWVINRGAVVRFGRLIVDGYMNESAAWNNNGSGASNYSKRFRNNHDNENWKVGARYEQPFGEGSQVTFLGSYLNHISEFDFKIENFRSALAPAIDVAEASSILDSEWNTSTLNLEVFADLNVIDEHETVVGINFQSDFVHDVQNLSKVIDTDGDGVFDSVIDEDTVKIIFEEQSRQVYAGFVQDTWRVFESLELTAGARFDRYSDFGSTINPRAAVVYLPTEKLTLKGLYGTAFRAPAFFELNRIELNEIEGNRLIENPDLGPEKIGTVELQAIYRVSPSLSVSLNLFDNEVDDVIRQVPVEDPEVPTQSEWQNSGSREWRGFELDLRFAPVKTFSAFANYSFVRTDDEAEESREVEGIPGQAFNFGANWLIRDRFNFNVNGNARFDWNAVSGTQVGDVRFEPIRLKSYAVINAGLRVDRVWKNLSLTFDVFNVFDQDQFFSSDRVFVPQGISGNNRHFLAGLKYEF